MKIFRVEDIDGKGPYTTGCVPYFMDSDTDHPGPLYDSQQLKEAWTNLHHSDRRVHYFAFVSLPQLQDWFSLITVDWVQDFAINVYDVPDEYVHIGNKQLIYKATESELIYSICKGCVYAQKEQEM